MSLRDRRVRLQGSYNFRDIGGYQTADGRTVRWERVYRSDALSYLTNDDLATLRPLGVRSLIDLRTRYEVEINGPGRLVEAHGAAHRHHPFVRDPVDPDNINALPDLPQLYADLIEHGAETIRSIFETLADDTVYPAVVHCAAGKDRTGIVVALILRTLGVDDATIAADYALTEQNFTEFTTELRRSGGSFHLGFEVDQIRPELLSARVETMLGFLEVVDTRFGGAEQLLTDSGVPRGARAQIRELLLERQQRRRPTLD